MVEASAGILKSEQHGGRELDLVILAPSILWDLDAVPMDGNHRCPKRSSPARQQRHAHGVVMACYPTRRMVSPERYCLITVLNAGRERKGRCVDRKAGRYARELSDCGDQRS